MQKVVLRPESATVVYNTVKCLATLYAAAELDDSLAAIPTFRTLQVFTRPSQVTVYNIHTPAERVCTKASLLYTPTSSSLSAATRTK